MVVNMSMTSLCPAYEPRLTESVLHCELVAVKADVVTEATVVKDVPAMPYTCVHVAPQSVDATIFSSSLLVAVYCS